MLPEEWLQEVRAAGRRWAPSRATACASGAAQAGLLDALLAAQPEASVDALFAKARDELRQFEGVAPDEAPRAFQGELRPYQEAGLGWLAFLRRFGFGGCLADDMGLGKTVQVLALLARRGRAGRQAPSLVVVPKSLVWNWEPGGGALRAEAARARRTRRRARQRDRAAPGSRTSTWCVTTYGTLRRTSPSCARSSSTTSILDEAQAIKNADSESAKAARLLRGEHRLALSRHADREPPGRAVVAVRVPEPRHAGRGARVRARHGRREAPEPETAASLARALRPFILRRTKEEVAPELPRKHEQTILCEMEPAQRRLYDELRDHYRDSLLGKDREATGWASRRSRCSRRCCACARPPATRA